MRHYNAKPAAQALLNAWAVRGVGNTHAMIHGIVGVTKEAKRDPRVAVVFANHEQGAHVRSELREGALPISLAQIKDHALAGFHGPVLVDHEATRVVIQGLMDEIADLRLRLHDRPFYESTR